MRISARRIQIIIMLTSIVCFFVSFRNYENYAGAYRGIVIFPIIYMISSLPLVNVIIHGDYGITTSMYMIMQWLRFCLMPAVISLAGDNCGSPYIHVSNETLSLAIWLMLIELIICNFYVFYKGTNTSYRKNEKGLQMTGEALVYVCFLALSAVVYWFFSKRGSIVEFFVLGSGTSDRIGDITDTSMVLVRQIVLVAIMVIFVASLSYGSKKYNLTGSIMYFILPLMVALLSVCIIVGERRTSQIYTAFCCMYCLSCAFPEKRKTIIRTVGGLAIIVLVLMSAYKMLYVFTFDSYTDALQSSSFSYSEAARSLQGYFSGPQNIAVALEFGKNEDVDIFNLIFDFVRSTPPFSFMVKQLGVITSVSFNTYIYGTATSSGHLLSTTGYGYICLGPLFYYLIMLFNIKLSFFCERKMKQSDSFEFVYVWGYLLMRFSFGVNINTPALINSSAILLITAGLLFKVSQIIRYNMRLLHGGKQ